MTTIERLEELAAKASERPWQTGRPGGALVTQGHCANPAQGAEDRAHYGGALVGESIGRIDQEFIVAVVNALPDLLRLADAARAVSLIDCESLPEERVAGPDGRCVICTLREALAPLLREEGS